MTRVFLSYASEDRARVDTLYQNLAAAGFQPWMDKHDLTPGEDWLKGIHRGIQSADCFVACLSKCSIAKDGVLRDELRTAVERWTKTRGTYRLIPARLEEVELPPIIERLQWCDLFGDEQWTKLAKAIRKRVWPPPWMRAAAITLAIVCVVAAVWYLGRDKGARWPPGAVRLGVTLWRLREPRPEDLPGSKMLVHAPPGESQDHVYVPERLALGKPIVQDERIRASFESSQQGFLYVLDQEQQTGGGLGPPKLIFPTKRLRGGRNQVAPGTLVETPAHEDSPPYWRVQAQSAGYAGEWITVIFAIQPIAELEPSEGARDVDATWLETRLREWQPPVTKTEAESGTAATPAEIQAGKIEGNVLTYSDPRPQTIFSGTPKPTVPLVARFLIGIARQ